VETIDAAFCKTLPFSFKLILILRQFKKMTNLEDMDVGCCEEDLSEAQKEFYEKSLKEYNQAVAEASKIKKGKISISIFLFEFSVN
jgi:hypothetical protein